MKPVPQKTDEVKTLAIKTKFQFSLHNWQNFSLSVMAILRKKRKVAAVSRKTPENRRNGQSPNTLDPEVAQDYFARVCEEIERRITKKTFRSIHSDRVTFLVAVSKLDEFFLNPQVRTCSVAVPWTSSNNGSENREPTRVRSLNHPCPEAVFSLHHSGILIGSELEETHHMVTGYTEEIRNRNRMMTGTQEEVPYCSPGTSSGKQKKASFTSQPQICSENTPEKIEADQILLALQHLATNSNSAHFNNNINRFSKLPKSLTTTMPTFDCKSEKFELFEELFQTSLKIHNQLTEEDKSNYFHSLMRGHALQTFKNITSPSRENLGETQTVFRINYVKPQSRVTAKHKFQRLVFNPANQKLIDFLAKDAFGVAAQDIIGQFIYAKMPPHLKKSINQAHVENGTYEEIVYISRRS